MAKKVDRSTSEQSKKRNQNRTTVLQTLQQFGAMRRMALADFCGIRKSSMTSIIDELLRTHVLINEVPERPRSPLVFTQKRWFAVAVHISQSEMMFARVDLCGKIYDEFTVDTPKTLKTLKKRLHEGVHELISKAPRKTVGVGIAAPGIVDSTAGIVKYASNLQLLNNVDLVSELQQKLDIPVVLENLVRSSLWESVWFGRCLARHRNVVYAVVTGGIGTAFLIDGQIYRGYHSSAGEIGHIRVGDESRKCICGKEDCLETYCTITALCAEIQKSSSKYKDVSTAEDIANVAQDPVVAKIIDSTMERFSRLLAPIITSLDPQALYLGDQNYSFYKVIKPYLEKHLQTDLKSFTSDSVEIEIAPSSGNSGLRGAAGLVFNEAFQGPFFKSQRK